MAQPTHSPAHPLIACYQIHGHPHPTHSPAHPLIACYQIHGHPHLLMCLGVASVLFLGSSRHDLVVQAPTACGTHVTPRWIAEARQVAGQSFRPRSVSQWHESLHVCLQFSRTRFLWHLPFDIFLAHFLAAHLPVVSLHGPPARQSE